MRYAETGFDLEIDLSRGTIERVETLSGRSGDQRQNIMG
jgi:hypothetical protein